MRHNFSVFTSTNNSFKSGYLGATHLLSVLVLLSADKKIFTCRIVCGKSGACRAISARSQNVVSGFVGFNQLGNVMRVTSGAILILDGSAPSLNVVRRDKKSASVGQAQGPTNFNPLRPRQKSATTKYRLVCGSLKYCH